MEERRRRAESALRSHGLDPEEVSWSMTPFHSSAIVPLETAVREAFLERLEAIVAEAWRTGVTGEDSRGDTAPPGEEPSAATVPAVPNDHGDASSSLAVACAGCRGACCRTGGPHAAHLTPDTVRRVRAARPGLTPEATVELFASHMGPRHVEGSCVFHDAEGCRLPRALRSDTCNDWFCADLDAVRRRWEDDASPPARHAFVAITSGREAVGNVRLIGP